MKSILKIIAVFSVLFTISCDNMYNDLAVEIGSEYDYFIAVAQNISGGQTQIYSLDYSGKISVLKSVLNNAPTMTVPMIAAHPAGKYLFIPYFSASGWMGSYKVNDDSSLTFVNNVGLASIISIAVHPTGKYLYSASAAADKIAEYNIDNNGALSAIGTSQTAPTGQNRMAISPAGDFLYTGGTSSGSMIYIFPVNPDGTVSTPTTTVALGGAPTIASIKVSHNGSLYCTTSSTGIYLYNKPTNTLVSQGSYGGGTNGFIAFHPFREYLYVASGTNCYLYKINGDNTLTYLSTYAAPVTINEMLIHPNGNILFITGTNLIYSYNINSSGVIQSQIQSISSSNADGLALIRRKK